MTYTAQGLLGFFVVVTVTVVILLGGIVAAMFIGRRALIRAHEAYTRELVQVQDQERARLAGEVHDDFGTQVALLGDALKEVRRSMDRAGADPAPLHRAEKEVTDLGESIRSLAHRLHPSRVDQSGLPAALHQLGADLGQELGLTVHWDGLGLALPNGPAGWALFRITQEALRNAARHGRATEAWVRFHRENGTVILEIRDHGIGFDPSQIGDQDSAGLGLRLMRERAGVVGGSVRVESRPEEGTLVHCRVPVGGAPAGPAHA